MNAEAFYFYFIFDLNTNLRVLKILMKLLFTFNFVYGGGDMPQDFKPGCARPKSQIELPQEQQTANETASIKKEEKPMISVGKKAPDFEMAGFYKGEFKTFRLSEYLGKWVVLCFYPGDFTFV